MELNNKNSAMETAAEDRQDRVIHSSVTSELLYAIKEGNVQLALHAAERRINIGVLHILDDELMEWKYYLVHILTLMMEIIITAGKEVDYPNQLAQEYIGKIHLCKNIDECYILSREMAERLCKVNENAKIRYPSLVQKIMECVSMDLQQPLTLQYFASLFNVNSSYLSNLFHKHTGVTITEYVTKIRIDHASTLLAYTRDPVRDIARKVGITDVQYFSRLFKRLTTLTPTQYRDQCMRNLIEPEVKWRFDGEY